MLIQQGRPNEEPLAASLQLPYIPPNVDFPDDAAQQGNPS